MIVCARLRVCAGVGACGVRVYVGVVMCSCLCGGVCACVWCARVYTWVWYTCAYLCCSSPAPPPAPQPPGPPLRASGPASNKLPGHVT